ncbi:MAG: hypothetical protein EKK57_00830 [Proteobacteria bacterium]|nr:MAG: hypothetical protein EKK57_00830 [Pseudomonadota bacterium]
MMNFNWKILSERVLTVGVGAFCMGFSKTYVELNDTKAALSIGVTWFVAGVFGGAAYDQIKYRDSRRNS